MLLRRGDIFVAARVGAYAEKSGAVLSDPVSSVEVMDDHFCYLCDHPEIEDVEGWTRGLIETDIAVHGWHIMAVQGAKKTHRWAYTIGLWQSHGVPELVLAGCDPHDAGHYLNHVGDRLRDGEKLPYDRPFTDLTNDHGHQLMLRPVHSDWYADELITWLPRYYREKVPVLQLVWSDCDDNFPGEPRFRREFRNRQPMMWLPHNAHPINIWRGHGLPAK
jgi:hypothetical protein